MTFYSNSKCFPPKFPLIDTLMMWRSDCQHKRFYFNQQWLNFRGLKLIQERGHGWRQGIHRDDRDQCFQVESDAYKNQISFEQTYRLKNDKGEFCQIFERAIPLFNHKAQFEGYAGTCCVLENVNHQSEQSLIDSSTDALSAGFWEWHILTDDIWYAPTFKKLLGYDEDPLDDKFSGFENLLHPQDQKRVLENLDAHLKSNKVCDVRCRLRSQSGGYRWFRLRGQSIIDEIGSPYRMMGSIEDITEQRLHIEKLERLASVAKDTDNLIVITDANGKTEWVNPAFTRRTGYTLADMLGTSQGKVLQGQNSDSANIDYMDECLKSGKSFNVEILYYTKTQDPYWVQINAKPIRNESGYLTKFIFIQTDITERKTYEKSLQGYFNEIAIVNRQLEQQRFALDQAAIISMTDEKGAISYVNDMFCGISKYSRSELMGQNHRIINSNFHDKDFFNNLWETISRGEVWRGDIRNKAKDGSFYWVSTTIVPFLGQDNKPNQYLSIRFDITSRKQVEALLLEQKNELDRSNKYLEKLAYDAAHDLQEPLRKIIGFGDLLIEEYAQHIEGNGREYLEYIQSSAMRMRKLIEALLAYSRLEIKVDPFVEVDLNGVLDHVLDVLDGDIKQKSAKVESVILPKIFGDLAQITQLMTHIVSNALKYCRPDVRPHMMISYECVNHDIVRIIFSDNGIGFEQKYAEDIFTPFKRLCARHDFEGTGIGLAICRKIIQIHHGRIKAISKRNVGSQFIIDLPTRSGKCTHAI